MPQGLTKKQQRAARGLAVDAASLPSARAAAAAAAAAAASGSSAAAGIIECPAGLKVGLFGQHCIDELQLPESALQRLAGESAWLGQKACCRWGCWGLLAVDLGAL